MAKLSLDPVVTGAMRCCQSVLDVWF